MTRQERRRIERAWAALAAHTLRACASCPGWEGAGAHSCCDPVHCESTIQYAREGFGVELERTELAGEGPDWYRPTERIGW